MLRSPSLSLSLRRRLPLRFEALEGRLAPAVFAVNNLNDSGTGSLRQAVEDANSNFGPDIVLVQVTGTITIDGQMSIGDDLTIVGPGSSKLTVDADFSSRHFNLDNDSASSLHILISGMTLINGDADGSNGGSIAVNDEQLVLSDVDISNSTAGEGGAIDVGFRGKLTMNQCNLSGNSATLGGAIAFDSQAVGEMDLSVISGNNAAQSGGGIFSRDETAVTIRRTTIANNTSSTAVGKIDGQGTFGTGGGIVSAFGSLAIQDSTVAGNSTSNRGGGIFIYGSQFVISNTTISGNTSGADGGGIYNAYIDNADRPSGGSPQPQHTIIHSTITGNIAGVTGPTERPSGITPSGRGGGIFTYPGFDIQNSIIAENSAGQGPDIFTDGESSVSVEFCLIGDSSSADLSDDGGNIFGESPLIGPLDDNGGPTKTHKLLSGSPALNTGDPDFAPPPTNDQRGAGFIRVAGSQLDMGAFEQQHGWVSGVVFGDNDGDGSPNGGEFGLSNVFVFLDANGNGAPDCDEAFGITDVTGSFLLESNPGTFNLIVVDPAGFDKTTGANHIVTIGAGETVEGGLFGEHLRSGINVFDGMGADAASIQFYVDGFRADLGALNPNAVGTQNNGDGRREINWDGVPSSFSAPNNLPSNFFNSNSPRGVVFNGQGKGFMVSANDESIPPRFGNLNTQYPGIFQTFSSPKLFTPLGTIVYDVDFFVAGTSDPASVSGFGAVFVDVDSPVHTSLEFFDANGKSLGVFSPHVTDNGLSFLGIKFTDGQRAAKVRVTTGNSVIGVSDGDPACFAPDVVVLDDFIYGEPVAITPPPPPPPETVHLHAVGAGTGAAAEVKVFDGNGKLVCNIDAYPNFQGGVRVAVGDIDGDGVDDVITGAGPGGGAHVQVFNGAKLLKGEAERIVSAIGSYFSYNPSFHGGVYVAAADVNGDGKIDIITGADAGGGPHVIAWDNVTGDAITSFYAYADNFRGGVRVAGGDIDGDGKAEIITGAGAGGGPHMRVFNSSGAVVKENFAFDASFLGGIYVGAGDIDGDGKADIIVGAGEGGGPHVKVFSGVDLSVLRSFFAYDAAWHGGVRVSSFDFDGDGHDDIITGAGPGGGPHAIAYSGDNNSILRSAYIWDLPFPFGIYVA